MSISKVKHLLVDLDGTLLGNRELPLTLSFILKAGRQFKGHGGWLRAARAIRAMRSELESTPVGAIPDITNEKRAVAAFGRALGLAAEAAEETLTTGMATIFPQLKRHFFPIREAQEFLQWARGHFPMTLATNPVWPEPLVKLRLEWAGIDPTVFSTITHAGIMHAVKPRPEYYQEVLRMVGHKAEECLLIGNDVRMDLPATRVGLQVFIVKPGTPVKRILLKGEKAPGWTGSFPGLRTMLEHSGRNG